MKNDQTALPEWVTETPEDLVYQLAVVDYHVTCATLQEIKLTRAEFITLKIRLAEMRGHMAKGPILTTDGFNALKQASELLQSTVEAVESGTAMRLGEYQGEPAERS